MAVMCRLSFVSTNNGLSIQGLSPYPFSSPPLPPNRMQRSNKPNWFSTSISASRSANDFNLIAFSLSKRILNLSIVAAALLCECDPFSISFSKAIPISPQALELERYTDSKEGFTLLKPSSWIKVDKAGATVLFEDANKGSNNVGVVVGPTRISNLSDFGSPRFVADKLIQAEKRKESTKEAEVIAVSQRTSQGGHQVYEFEYKVDSTRGGMKRVFSAAFVASRKLYLLNISHSDGLESPLNPNRRMILEKVLHSFDVA